MKNYGFHLKPIFVHGKHFLLNIPILEICSIALSGWKWVSSRTLFFGFLVQDCTKKKIIRNDLRALEDRELS